jgi:ubiquinone/menaquinone biosynthesis C-methylase UbiE
MTNSFGGPNPALKSAVREHWERETCGIRYAQSAERQRYIEEVEQARYSLEPYIPVFADFPSGAGLNVLEIGVGAGTDFSNWCRYAAHATGVDLTESAVDLTMERLQLADIDPSRYTVQRADSEQLPFPDCSFDLVYSWGVLHHTPDTPAAFREVHRVLKPGGRLKAMIYHKPSWTGLLLVIRHGWLRGRFGLTQKAALFENLESPGTKAYTVAEAREILESIGFADLRLGTKLGPGDLLTIKLSEKYSGVANRLAQRLYPRWFVRLLGDRFGLNLTIEAIRP